MANDEHVKLLLEGVKGWNRWREEHSEIRPDLTGADLNDAKLNGAALSGADLSGADLSGADLSGAALSGADLNGADLGGATLTGADLSGADLRGAMLYRADINAAHLNGADLGGATLIGATLTGADLQGANFEFCRFIATGVGTVDLSKARGLADAEHFGPSIIGTNTLKQTAAGLATDASRQAEVETFLRGAGVEEDLLDWWRTQIGQPIEFYSAFISYSHADKDFARRMYNDLQMKGIRCWLDEHELLPGDDIYARVDRGIRIWDKVLLCCSEAALTSWWVDNEITAAFEKEQKLRKDRGEQVLSLIPLNLDGYIFDGWTDGKAPQVRKRLAADFTGWEADNDKYNAALERIVAALRPGDAGRKSEPEPKL